MTDLGPWDGFAADPRRRDVGALRASDADRDHAAGLLAEAYADGRLDSAEHDLRLDQAMSATHLRDFVPLLSDLSPSGASVLAVAPKATPPVQVSAGMRNGMGIATLALLAMLAVMVVSGSSAFWWLLFPICFFILPRTASLFRPTERPRGQGGTHRLPKPGDDYRQGDD